MLTIGLAFLVWLVATLALWALGYPLSLLASGIVAGILGLLLVASAVSRR